MERQASSLRPLRPSNSELKSVLDELKQLRHKMASKLSVTDLQEHIAQSAKAT
ncbi:MAG: hypothetical protein V4858_03995 [Pseudomonadota bacterium]